MAVILICTLCIKICKLVIDDGKLGPYFRFKFFLQIIVSTPPICYKRPLICNLYTFMNHSTMLNLKEGKKMKVKLELDQELDKEMIILKTKTQSSEIKEIVAYIEQRSTPLVGKKSKIKTIG